MARKGKKARRAPSSAYEWTGLEKALTVAVVVLLVSTAYLALTNQEVVEVGSIETYEGRTDLRAGDENNSSYSFERLMKVDYQVRVIYEVPYAGMGLRPIVHFKAWNETTGLTIFPETTQSSFNERVTLDPKDAGNYEFIWWVEGEGGWSQVKYSVLIEPTEKLFMDAG